MFVSALWCDEYQNNGSLIQFCDESQVTGTFLTGFDRCLEMERERRKEIDCHFRLIDHKLVSECNTDTSHLVSSFNFLMNIIQHLHYFTLIVSSINHQIVPWKKSIWIFKQSPFTSDHVKTTRLLIGPIIFIIDRWCKNNKKIVTEEEENT